MRHTPTLSLRPGPCMRLRPRAHLGPRAHARPKALVIQASTWGAACVRPARAARTDACMRLVHGGRERAARVLHREVLPYRLELLACGRIVRLRQPPPLHQRQGLCAAQSALA